MKTNFVTFLILIITFLGCKKSDNINNSNSNFVIYSGVICQPFSGLTVDTLQISQNGVRYVSYFQGSTWVLNKTKILSISSNEWTNIANSINIKGFEKLQYNACGRCSDGCDNWLKIKNDTMSHQIYYDAPIDSLTKLQSYITQYRNQVTN